MKANKCPLCKKGYYTHGSALYDYYSCGHAYEKPLHDDPPEGRMVSYKSPYPPYCYRYDKEDSK